MLNTIHVHERPHTQGLGLLTAARLKVCGTAQRCAHNYTGWTGALHSVVHTITLGGQGHSTALCTQVHWVVPG